MLPGDADSPWAAKGLEADLFERELKMTLSQEHELALHPLRGLALCAGIGGIELGLRMALGDAYRTVCYSEIEAFAASVLEARIKDGLLCDAPIWSDLKTFDSSRWRGRVDIVTGGFPCQPWSLAGRRKGTEDPRHLWPYFVQHIRAIGPRFVFCENVPGLLTVGFEQVCQDLSTMGYSVEAGIYSAAEQGAPHLRKRIFFLAYADDARLWLEHRRGRRPGGEGSSKFEQHGQKRHVAHADDVSGGQQCSAGQPLGGQNDSLHAHGKQNVGGSSYSCEAMAHADSERLAQRQGRGENAAEKQITTLKRDGRVEPVAHADSVYGRTRGAQPKIHVGGEQFGGRGYEPSYKRAGAAEPCVCGENDGICPWLDGDLSQSFWGPDWEQGTPRTAIGVADRIDRLRSLGNAVVPQVAAFAFTDLIEKATAG